MERPPFIPGLDLNRAFYREVLRPLLAREFPGLEYSAGLIGYGSDVFGFDTPTSTDHNWGPRGLLFLGGPDAPRAGEIRETLARTLPLDFRGWPTHFTDPRYDATQTMEPAAGHPVRHLVEVFEVQPYFRDQLGVGDLDRITAGQWLGFDTQVLFELTSGEVFHDGLGTLVPLRRQFGFYPADAAKLKLAALWQEVWNQEAFVGRSIETGDFLGLKLVSANLVRTLMKISFLLEDRYYPYGKWFGPAFLRLPSAGILGPLVSGVLSENGPQEIETRLCALYTAVVERHNARPGLPRLENKIQNFFGRPYRVIFAETIAEALVGSLSDPQLKTTDLDQIRTD